MNVEVWDAYYPDGTLAGCDLVRGEPIPDGLCHLAVDVLVRHTDGTILLMKRDPRKPNFPGYYEASAGGSALKGEDAETAAYRELWEETGIRADKLIPSYRIFSPERKCLYHGFLCLTSCKKDSIVLQEGETVAYRWVTPEELLEMKEQVVYWERVLEVLGIRESGK